MIENYMGKDGFVWFMGVVEDRQDPLELGRCKVRCLGFHTDDKLFIPTEKLPWAMPVQPITSAAMNGIGQSPLGPLEGSWVVGFFRDGPNAQQPIFFGTVGGYPQEIADISKGFNDPNGKYPKEDFLAEPDTNRLARGATGTIVEDKINAAASNINIPTANGAGGVWFEPTINRDEQPGPTYPYNHVYESESGHIQEFDDTPGAERIHTFHRTGTFEEIYPDGSKVTKIMGQDYNISMGNKFVQISGNANVIVGDDSGNSNLTLYVKGNVDMQVDGNVTEVIGGNVTQTVEGGRINITTNPGADGGVGSIGIDAGGQLDISSIGPMSLHSDAEIRLRAPIINLN
jgi:hypothetical protein